MARKSGKLYKRLLARPLATASNNFLVRRRKYFTGEVTRGICSAKPSAKLSQVFYSKSPYGRNSTRAQIDLSRYLARGRRISLEKIRTARQRWLLRFSSVIASLGRIKTTQEGECSEGEMRIYVAVIVLVTRERCVKNCSLPTAAITQNIIL